MRNEGKKNSYNPDLAMIGENIRKRCEALGMLQTELANGLETNCSAICRYENGTREMEATKLLAFADLLKCEPADILIGKQDYPDAKVLAILQRLEKLSLDNQNQILSAVEFMVIGAEKNASESSTI